jgi:transcriptional regulator with XRE-family HTH domain
LLALRYYRQRRGLSQKDLAALVGSRQATICRIERGELRPSDDLLGRIADALEFQPAFALLRGVRVHQSVEPEDDYATGWGHK